MKTFRDIVEETDKEVKGITINKDGEVVPNDPINFKQPAPKKVKKKTLKEGHEPLDSLPGQVKASTTAQFKKARAQYQSISDKLHSAQKAPSKAQKGHLSKYTEGDEGAGVYSYGLNKKLIHNHKAGLHPTAGMDKTDQDLHHTVSTLAKKPLGHETHLYSGVGFNPKKAMGKSSNGILHLPAHMSTTHVAGIAAGFADASHAEHGHGRHIIHIHAKATDKGYHIGKHSETPEEHETVIPAGTKLKYSHSTTHHDSIGQRVQVHHFTIHSQ